MNNQVNDSSETKNQFGYKQELSRVLTLRDMVIYGMIFMVPIAPFGIYGFVADGAKGMVSLSYLIGMCAMIFTALSYKAMANEFPIAGSVYSYAQRGIHPFIGFLSGWVLLMDYILIPALLYVVAAVALSAIIPGVPIVIWVVAFIIINTLINVRGIEMTAKANYFMLIAELIVLAVFVVLGIFTILNTPNLHFTIKPFYNADTFSFSFVMGAVSLAVLSFLGFDGISTLAEEAKEGSKSVGKACIISLFSVGVLFILQTYIAGCIWPDYTTFSNADSAFYEVAAVAGGNVLKVVCSVATVISWGIANALASQAATARIIYSMSRDKNLPAILSHVHPKYKTPINSTYLVAAVSLIVGILFSSKIDALTSIVNFGALTAFMVLHISVINYFIRVKKSKDYVTHLLLPCIGLVVIGYVWLNLDLHAKVLGLIWTVIGIVYYVVLRKINGDVKIDDSVL